LFVGGIRLFMSGSIADSAAAPTLLFVMPWSPDAIGGVSEVVVNLYRAFTAKGLLNPRLLIEAYPHRRVVSIPSRTLGMIDGMYNARHFCCTCRASSFGCDDISARAPSAPSTSITRRCPPSLS
jgi:hypothetical protein